MLITLSGTSANHTGTVVLITLSGTVVLITLSGTVVLITTGIYNMLQQKVCLMLQTLKTLICDFYHWLH